MTSRGVAAQLGDAEEVARLGSSEGVAQLGSRCRNEPSIRLSAVTDFGVECEETEFE